MNFGDTMLARSGRKLASCCTLSFFIFLIMVHINHCNTFPINPKNISVTHDERKLENIASGKYSYLIQFSDGTKLEQRGNLNSAIVVVSEPNVADEANNGNGGKKDEIPRAGRGPPSSNGLSVSGSYAFVDPSSGLKHEVRYTADKSGYHPHYISTSSSHNATKNELQESAGGNFAEMATPEDGGGASTPLPPLETISASLFSSLSETF